jgi:hypothetical protein
MSVKSYATQGMAITEEKTSGEFEAFKQMLLTTFEVRNCSDLPFKKLEYAFDIFSSSKDFLFDDKDERLTNFLVFMATLYTHKKSENVCFISPTYYYAQQATDRIIKFSELFFGSKIDMVKSPITCVVPGMVHFESAVNKSKVLFMHGKDFSDYLPTGWQGRKIIQIFPGENVPVDPIKRSYCSMHERDD